MADSNELLYFCRSGRYACRLGYLHNDLENSPKRAIHLIDFEEETCTEIILITFGSFRISFIYWLDETHIGVLLTQLDYRYHHTLDEFNTKHRPKMALYEVDFSQTEWKAKKVIYNKENEKNMPQLGHFHVIEGYLNIDDQEYLAYRGEVNWLEPTNDPEYFDLVQAAVNNGNSADFMWLRFIPKRFENEKEVVEKLFINCTEIAQFVDIDTTEWYNLAFVAHDNKLFFLYDGINIVVFDICEYIRILRESIVPPVLAELCTRVKIPTPNGYRVMESYLENGLMYIPLTEYDDWDKLYMRIWDIEEEKVTGMFQVDKEPTANEEGGFAFLHPCGRLLQVEISTVNNFHYMIEEKNFRWFRRVTKKMCYFKFLSMRPVRKELKSLQQLASEQEILNKATNTKKLPRCLGEGRNQLILKLNREELDLPNWFFSTDE